jgi:hypothetical protein
MAIATMIEYGPTEKLLYQNFFQKEYGGADYYEKWGWPKSRKLARTEKKQPVMYSILTFVVLYLSMKQLIKRIIDDQFHENQVSSGIRKAPMCLTQTSISFNVLSKRIQFEARIANDGEEIWAVFGVLARLCTSTPTLTHQKIAFLGYDKFDFLVIIGFIQTQPEIIRLGHCVIV